MKNKDNRDLYNHIVAKNKSFIFELEDKLIAFGYTDPIDNNKIKYVIECNEDVIEKYKKFKKTGMELKKGHDENGYLEYDKKKSQFQTQYNSITINIKRYLRNANIELYEYIEHLNENDINIVSNQMKLLGQYYKEYLH